MHADHDRAEQRADHGARAAEDVDAADDHGGDHLQFQPRAGLDGDVAEAGEEHEAGKAGERAAKHEGDEDDALHRQADERRRVGVRADGIEPPAERSDSWCRTGR